MQRVALTPLEPLLSSLSAFTFPRILECPGTQRRLTELLTASSFRSSLHFRTSLDVIRKPSSAIKASRLSEKMTIGWFLTLSINKALAHSAIALISAWKKVANGSRLHMISRSLHLLHSPAPTPFWFLELPVNQIIPCSRSSCEPPIHSILSAKWTT